MKVFSGQILIGDIYCEAIQTRTGEEQVITVYNLGGILWTSHKKERLYQEKVLGISDHPSNIFPKVTDFFPKNIESIMVKFKETETTKDEK